MRRRSEGNDPRSRALSFHARSCDAESFLSVSRSPSTSAAFFLALHRLICASRQLRGLLRATRLPAFSPGRRPRANAVRRVAPVAGVEPATKGLTVLCATTALHRNKESLSRNGKVEGNLSHSAVPCQSPTRSRRRDCFTSDFERFDVMPRRLTDFSPDFSPLDRKPPVVYTTRSSARVRRWTTPRRRSTRTPQ